MQNQSMKKLRIFFLAAWLLGSFFSLHGAEKEIARVKIDEIEWPETREFAIEVKQGDAWKEVARGATIGANKQITFSICCVSCTAILMSNSCGIPSTRC
jgi:hypothetical protein